MPYEIKSIVLYLIEQYDTNKKLTHDTLIEKNQLDQWLMFQMSEQGLLLRTSKLASAPRRYFMTCSTLFRDQIDP